MTVSAMKYLSIIYLYVTTFAFMFYKTPFVYYSTDILVKWI